MIHSHAIVEQTAAASSRQPAKERSLLFTASFANPASHATFANSANPVNTANSAALPALFTKE